MHIVICGYLRSGTTMLYNMLRTSVVGYQFYEREYPALRFVGESGNRITKRPFDSKHYEEIIKKIPDAKFIGCIRDPRDVLCSKHWAVDEFNVSWDKSIHTVDGGKVTWSRVGLLKMDEWLRKVPCSMFLKYEDLVNIPDLVQDKMKQIFRFSYKAEFKDFYRTIPPKQLTQQMKGIRPVENSRIGIWKNYPERIAKQFIKCPQLFEVISYRGYLSPYR